MTDTFRNYTKTLDKVEQFYKDQHENQTVEYVQKMITKYAPLDKKVMTIWEAFDMINEIVDDSDPDINKTQDVHSFQTSEACRKLYPGEEYDWFHLTGFIHDLGKVLCHPEFGESQIFTVGDTNPVGCKFDENIVYHEYFELNPDNNNPKYNTQLGIYEPNCGLDNVLMNFGHDWYLYHVLQQNNCRLPPEAFHIIRYHSFYSWHQNGSYKYLCNFKDEEYLHWVKEFQKCDLYSKSNNPEDIPNVEELKPYYEKLIKKYFPNDKLRW